MYLYAGINGDYRLEAMAFEEPPFITTVSKYSGFELSAETIFRRDTWPCEQKDSRVLCGLLSYRLSFVNVGAFT